ncbi:MAG: hypothetical protein GAK45_00117 [Pseudomonas citronellolis]|nr:MAG: hypothetical protein GAK45_00117 [Pseudomonas citronellolis]
MKHLLWIGAAAALLMGSQLAQAADCASVLEKVKAERHLTQVGKGETHVQFHDGPQVEVSFGCLMDKPDLLLDWDGQNPDKEYFYLVGRLGQALTGNPAATVIKVAKTCRQQALQDTGEISQIENPTLVIGCQAYKRDGGATSISIFPN